MPRRKQPPRLELRRRRGREPVYVIRDADMPGRERSTGCGPGREREAEAALQAWIAEKSRAPAGPEDPERMTVGHCLSIYLDQQAPTLRDPVREANAVDRLAPFWGELTVSAVKGATCRRYMKTRTTGPQPGKGRGAMPASAGTVRRELATLSAALHFCEVEGFLTRAPRVWLPEKPPRRERWYTRDEVAALVREARRRRDTRHIARFLLVAVYTGTRKDAILRLQFGPNTEGGHVDLGRGMLYRRSAFARETSKRQPPARLPRQLLGHLRRWQRLSRQYVVETADGMPVGDVKTGWRGIHERAGIAPAPIHTTRHTAITWAMQRRAEPVAAAGFFGVSLRVMTEVYLHHHPDHQKSAVEAMERKA